MVFCAGTQGGFEWKTSSLVIGSTIIHPKKSRRITVRDQKPVCAQKSLREGGKAKENS